MEWSQARCEEANAEIKKKGTLADAAVSLSLKWRMKITREMLKSGLYRARKRVPVVYDPSCVSVEAQMEQEIQDIPDVSNSGIFPPWQNYSPEAGYVAPKPSKIGKVTSPQVERGVIIPDTHVPLQDPKAWACALSIIKEVNPSFGIIIGDFADLGSLSRHPKSKPDITKLAAEYYATNLALDEIQSRSPNCKWFYIEGNHEHRAVSYMNEQGNLFGMLDVPHNLYITPKPDNYFRGGESSLRGMTWVDYEHQPLITSHSSYYHGIHFINKHHSASNAEQYCPVKCKSLPLFYGHVHTLQSFTAANGCFAQCCGFLGNEDSLGYLNGKPTSWQHGLVVQEVCGTQMSYSPVRITNGRAVVLGKLIQT